MASKNKKRTSVSITKWLALVAILLSAIWALGGLLPGQAAFRYHFEIGERMVYRIEFNGAGTADFRPLLDQSNVASQQQAPSAGMVQAFSTAVRGDLMATVVAEDGQDFTVAYTFRNVAVESEVGAQRNPEQSEILRRDLQRVMFATVNPEGRIRAVRFEAGIDPSSQTFLRAVLGAIQVVLPEKPQQQATSWETEEDDSSGKYTARYEFVPGDANVAIHCKTIRKTKLNYLPNASSGRKPAHKQFVKRDDKTISPTVQPDANVAVCFDVNSRRLVSLRGSEKQVITVAGNTIGRSETFISLEFVRKEIDEAWLRNLRQISATGTTTPVPLSAQPSAEEVRAIAQRGTLGDATLESLLVELARQEASGAKEDTELFLKFRALAELKPESCATLGRLLATTRVSSLTFRILSEAIGEAAGPESQTALVTAIRSRRDDWQALFRLVPLLGLSKQPTVQAEEALFELAFGSSDPNITSTAQLALGNVAHRLAEKHPDRATKIVQRLVERLTGKSDDEIQHLLLVLGNAGLVDVLPIIARFVSHSSQDVRATAVSALRFIESEQADELLIKALSGDSSSAVRQAAAYALRFREMTLASFNAHKQSLLKDENEDVRLAILANLWNERETFTEISELVKKVANDDQSANVRNRASALLRNIP